MMLNLNSSQLLSGNAVVDEGEDEEEEGEEAEEVYLRESGGIQRPESSSSLQLSSLVPVVLIHGWLLSFSHYIALYSMLTARLGTRCDCRKLRAKSEVVRRRSVNYARRCQDTLLPIVNKVGLTLLSLSTNYSQLSAENTRLPQRSRRKSNLEDYCRLFFLHCTCLEFFIGQLLRTASLFHSFSLNIGRSLTSSLVSPPPNFIYSGLAEVERPKKKRPQLLSRRGRDDSKAHVNESLSGVELELASRNSFGPSPSDDHETFSSDHSHPIAASTDCMSQQDNQNSCDGENCKPSSSICEATSIPSTVVNQASSRHNVERKKKLNHPVHLPHSEYKKRIIESDTECLEKLVNDIRLVRGMIVEIQTTVPVYPWANCEKVKTSPNGDQEISLTENICEMVEGLQGQSDADYINNGTTSNEDGNGKAVLGQEMGRLSPCHIKQQPRLCYSFSSSRWWLPSRRKPRLSIGAQRRGRLRRVTDGFEEKSQEDDETVVSKRLRRKQYICLSFIIAISIGLFGSALGSCIYLLT